ADWDGDARAVPFFGLGHMSTDNGTLALLPQHLADLRKSGLSDAQINRCRFRSLSGPVQIGERLRWGCAVDSLGACLEIPFFAADGTLTDFARLKPDKPITDRKTGNLRRYEQPKGIPTRPYFPPGFDCADRSLIMLITEGEKKCARAAQDGFTCIGLC